MSNETPNQEQDAQDPVGSPSGPNDVVMTREQVMIDEIARQVAEKTKEVAFWKTESMILSQTLEELKEELDVLRAVIDEATGDEAEEPESV